MFTYADADCDGRINWSEFQTMICPPHSAGQWAARPDRTDITKETTIVHPHTLSVASMMPHRVDGRLLREGRPGVKKSKVVSLMNSETHVLSTWTQIGLHPPVIRQSSGNDFC